ncbi:putative HVA22/TB2/DP1 family protein [Gregarina niphandrodes]|uniref:HVA22/TB2/DP1 family protein n=1 Tax=Gregarina niphandrodes TaxID=110365 RepID=A0A023B4U4_GRENI|nr:putative HVA22/TB2/DP1 family protein [Gregarina niphandrodes]EZG57833.1 putative HVA22/TB2/DP1 family protein [Gregarina niphandrodes]|eukprot:XP_011131030.1 putative HVA22/TB2/DP1 family protein [Gregarina niphandrodes]
MAGFFYPAWQSFKAIETGSHQSSRQWLAYWVVYASFAVVELFSDILLFWIPFYYVLKLAFLLWLSLPQFHGATIVYDNILQPFLTTYQGKIDGYERTQLDAHLAAHPPVSCTRVMNPCHEPLS